MTNKQKELASLLDGFHHARWVGTHVLADRLATRESNVRRAIQALAKKAIVTIKEEDDIAWTRLTPVGRQQVRA